MNFKIITPLRAALDAEVHGVKLPGSKGEMEILPGHADMIASIDNGELSYRLPGGEVRSLFVGGGFLQVEGSRIILVTDTAVEANEINTDSVQQALERARKALRDKSSVLSREEQTFLEASIAKQLSLLDYRKRKLR